MASIYQKHFIKLLIVFWLILFPNISATEPNSLTQSVVIADQISVTQDQKLIASGNVEVLYGSQQLTAQSIIYDPNTETLQILGPIQLTDGQSTTILADTGELHQDLKSGILRGARLVLDDFIQLATVQLNHNAGQYSKLHKTVATSCQICEKDDVPLWQIRAREVIHDQNEKQLYFYDAHLRVKDLPILYLPYLRLPEPSIDRSSGFLIPSIRTTTQLSTGIKIPYFQELGDHADITITPYLSTRTHTLNLNYRHEFWQGRIALEGSVTRDDLIPHTNRGYFLVAGGFALKNKHELYFDIEWASENAYLYDYDLPNKDRLDSEIALTRTGKNSFYRSSFTHFQSLREGEIENEIPTLLTDFDFRRRYFPKVIDGELRLQLLAHANRRSSSLNEKGRDIAQTNINVSWLRSKIFANAIKVDWQLGVLTNFFRVKQDLNFPSSARQTTPYGTLSFRLPVTRSNATETDIIEPVMQIGWSKDSGGVSSVPELGSAEFDQGSLLSLSRFSTNLAEQNGLALAYGLKWTRINLSQQLTFSVGQVIFDREQEQQGHHPALSHKTSDLLFAGQLTTSAGVTLTARTLVDRDLNIANAEFHGTFIGRKNKFDFSHILMSSNPSKSRLGTVSELNFEGSVKLNHNWDVNANLSYDVSDHRGIKNGVGFTYVNECVEINFSINRHNTSSENIRPATEFQFNVVLRGFSSSKDSQKQVQSCKG
ncbi:MAG: LPS assembly protein LptD [Aestuariivita sp.]|nr:LPS assembly protein LptD [Aestuariivita sp.]